MLLLDTSVGHIWIAEDTDPNWQGSFTDIISLSFYNR